MSFHLLYTLFLEPLHSEIDTLSSARVAIAQLTLLDQIAYLNRGNERELKMILAVCRQLTVTT